MDLEALLVKHGEEIRRERLGWRRIKRMLGVSRHQAERLQMLAQVAGEKEARAIRSEAGRVSAKSTSSSYLAESDTYVVAIRNELVQMPGRIHRAIREEFSNWNGKPASFAEIATKHKLSPDRVRDYIHALGWKHDDPPALPERLSDPKESALDLVQEGLNSHHEQYRRLYQKERIRLLERDSHKYHRMLDEVSAASKFLSKPLPSHLASPVPALSLPRSQPFALVLAPQDFHWGGYAWVDETGTTYSRVEAERRLFTYTQEVVDRLPGKPEKIYLSVGGDWFHVDGDHSATTRGTPLDSDGSPSEIFMTGCALARAHVDLLRQIAPVELVFMAGNHDRANSLGLLMYLSGVYERADDVKVHLTVKLRTYLKYRNVLLGFTHGDKVKANRLGEVMATEARTLWGETSQGIFFTGHLHHEVYREIDGILHCQLPSLSGTDRWHKREGFVGARSGLCGHLIGENGLIQTIFAQVRS
jgi:predicted phosphodiesterase